MAAIDKIRRGETFTGRKLLDALKEAGRPIQGGPDTQVVSSAIGDVVKATRDERNRPVTFYAKIGVATQDGPNRWTYAWTEQLKTSAGYDGWTLRPLGRTDINRDIARNYCEESNSASGLQGNGVTIPDPDTNIDITIKEIPPDRIVQMFEVTLATASATQEYWFDEDNPITVECGP